MPRSVQAAAEGLPEINRRALMGALLPAAAGVAVMALPSGTQAAGSPAMALLAQHKGAEADWDAAWDVRGDIDDTHIPLPKVEIGCDAATGQPIYANFEREVDAHIDRWLSAVGNAIAERPGMRERWEERRALLKGELARQEAEVRAMEDACGITAATAECERAEKVMRDAADRLFVAKPETLEEVFTVAAYVVEHVEAESAALDEVDALAFLRGLAAFVATKQA